MRPALMPCPPLKVVCGPPGSCCNHGLRLFLPRTLREIGRMWRSLYLPGRSREEAAKERDRSAEVVEALPTRS